MNEDQKIELKLFVLEADYRPFNEYKPRYYVAAKTARGAKKIFENTYTWLKVYNVDEITDEVEGKQIMSDYKKRPCLFSKD